MYEKSLLMLLISLFLITGCGAKASDQSVQPTPPKPNPSETNKPQQIDNTEQTQRHHGFSHELFQAVFKEEGLEDNTFISPYSMQMALLLLANGIDEVHRELIMDTLHLAETDLDEVNEQLQEMLETFNSYAAAELNTANSLWHINQLTVIEDYEKLISSSYNGEIRLMPDLEPEEEINDWVSDKTNGLIPKMVDQVDPNIVAYLMNAVYFQANWQNEFQESSTTPETFHLLNGETMEHPMMRQTETFPFVQGDDFRAMKIPYEQEGLHMAVVLPDQGEFENIGLNIEEALLSTDWIQQEVELRLPAFSFSANYSMEPQLTELGLGRLFEHKVYLPYIFEEPESFEISEITHKTFIDVDEEGTEAVAATSIGFTIESAEVVEIKPFIVDRPFLFAIIDETTDTILFMGSVIKPEIEEGA